MRRRLLRAWIICLVVVLGSCQAPAASSLPAIVMPMEGPTVIDVPAAVVSTTVVTPAGASIAADGVRVAVPAGGVDGDTAIIVTRLDAPFRMNPYAPSDPANVAAIAIGHAYDFGPAGVQFAQPVEVTLSYDPRYVPAGTDPGLVAAAYFNGTRWAAIGGVVDPVARTVTVRLQAFDGSLLVLILATVAIGYPVTQLAVPPLVDWLYGGEGVNSDAISEGRAEEWVVPRDPAVVDWAGRAVIVPRDGGGLQPDQAVPLAGDPTGVAPPFVGWALEGRQFALSFRCSPAHSNAGACPASGGEPIRMTGRSSAEAFANWQKPADYFNKNGLRGDCTDMANAWVSVLRSLGYEAKGVFGYALETLPSGKVKRLPHVWAEVVVGGLPFIMDDDGWFWPMDQGMSALKLVRATPDDPRNAMWDETGQTPYVEGWWVGPGVPAASSPVRLEPGWELATSVPASHPTDPGDRRLYLTITRAYEFEGRKLVTIAVFEYRYFANGHLNDNPSGRVFFTEVEVKAGVAGDPVADGLARAAEFTAGYIAEQGLLPGLPVCFEGRC